MKINKDVLFKLAGLGLAAGTSGGAYFLSEDINDFFSEDLTPGMGEGPDSLDKFGIPRRCSWVDDTYEDCGPNGRGLGWKDLRRIRFEGIADGEGTITVTKYSDESNTVTLTISGEDYIFNNSGNVDIEIKRENVTILLKAESETRFKATDDNKLKVVKLGDFGIPEDCVSECKLSQVDLKEIKFKGLGSGDDEVIVESFPEEKITLKIIGEGADKRYIFENPDETVEIRKGDQSVSLKAFGRTKFTGDGDELKELEMNDYGLPIECETNSNKECTLEEDDLKDIRFKDFIGETGDVSVVNFPEEKITLKIVGEPSSGRYIFTNNSEKDVEIERGDRKVTLNKSAKTKFIADGTDLELFTLNSLGVPAVCETNGTCVLEEDDLKEIKFETFSGVAGEATVSGLTEGKKITLKIDNTDEEGKKKYIFTSDSDNDVKIEKGGREVTLNKKAKTKFKTEGEVLKEEKLNDLGLPSDCEKECRLSADDLADINFEGLGESGTTTVTAENLSGQIITLRIEGSDADNNKKYVFTDNTSEGDINIERGGKTVTLKAKGDSKFSEEGGKLKTLELTELGLPANCKENSECSLSESDLKDIKFKDLDGAESSSTTVTNLPSPDTITLKIEKMAGTGNNKYIFINDKDKSIEIERGEGKKVTLGSKDKTRFIANNSKLELETLGKFGLPQRCSVGKECKLSSDDLERIKFKDLGEESDGKVSVSGLTGEQTIILRIENGHGDKKKYIFTNSNGGDVVIKRGDKEDKKVTLKAGGKTKFSEGQDKLTPLQLGNFGLPEGCNSQCTLSADDLEDVKFTALGEEKDGNVSVDTTQSVTLKIEEDGGKKRYIFTNPGTKDINIQRGSKSSNKVTLKAKGKTRFEEDSGKDKLKAFTTANYGLPSECISSNLPSECKLSQDDLEMVKFEGFGESTDSKIDNFPAGTKITVKVVQDGSDNNRYIFINDSDKDIKITNGPRTVTLNKKEKTNFTPTSNKCQLQQVSLSDLGLPSYCKSNCTLIEGDMERIKFQALGKGQEKVSISTFPAEKGKVTLNVDSGDADNTKYIFKNNHSAAIVIQRGTKGNNKVTLAAKGETKFTNDKGELKIFDLDNNGLPKECFSRGQCALTKNDLEAVKFSALDGSGTVSGLQQNKTIAVKIIKDGSNNSRFVFSTNSGTDVKISKSSQAVTIKKGEKTRFTNDQGKLKQLSLNAQGLPTNCTSTCSLVSDDLEQVKFDGFSDAGDATVTNLSDTQKISLKIVKDGFNKNRYIFTNSSGKDIKITKGRTSADISKGKTRFTEDKGKLKKLSLDAYGLPSGCTTCDLIQDDLEQVKFSVFRGEGVVSLLPANGKIAFKVENISGSNKKKYVFENKNKSTVTIKNGSTSVYLQANKKTKFMVDEKSKTLKMINVASNGVPSSCVKGKPCTISLEDLMEIKFPKFGDGGAVSTVNSNSPSITLTIEDHYENNRKKYIFNNQGKTDIVVQRGNEKITLKPGKNRFDGAGNQLGEWKFGFFDLPDSCDRNIDGKEKRCRISKDDIEKIKFQEFNGATGTVTGLGDDETIELRISGKTTWRNGMDYKFYKEKPGDITITNGGKKITIHSGSLVYFSGVKWNQLQVGGVGSSTQRAIDLQNQQKQKGRGG